MSAKPFFATEYEKDLSVWDPDQCNVWVELPVNITENILLKLRYISEMGMLVHLNTGDRFQIPSENAYNFIWHADNHSELREACDLRITFSRDTILTQEPLLFLDQEKELVRTEVVSRIARCLNI